MCIGLNFEINDMFWKPDIKLNVNIEMKQNITWCVCVYNKAAYARNKIVVPPGLIGWTRNQEVPDDVRTTHGFSLLTSNQCRSASGSQIGARLGRRTAASFFLNTSQKLTSAGRFVFPASVHTVYISFKNILILTLASRTIT